MIRTFAVLLDQIHVSQQSYYIISNLNRMVEKHVDICPLIFYQTYGPYPITPKFSTMQEIEAWSFDGDLIATNLNSAKTAIECPRASRRFFYIWDLEWIYRKSLPFSMFAELYCHPSLDLIVRSQNHYDIVSQCWKQPKYIIEDFNLEEIYNENNRLY